MSQNNMQDQGAAGGSAAGAHSAELSKAEKTIESLKYELRQVRPYLTRLFNMDKVLEDLKSDKEKLEGKNAEAEHKIWQLKNEIDRVKDFLRQVPILGRANEDLKSDKEKLEGENARLKRDKVTYKRTLAKLLKKNKELRGKLQEMRRSRR